MTKSGSKILEGAKEALAYAKGEADTGFRVHAPEMVDVKKIRRALDLTQEDFAAQYGFDVASVRNWEQGRRQPEGPARVLLYVIARDPGAVRRALTSGAAAYVESFSASKRGAKSSASRRGAARQRVARAK